MVIGVVEKKTLRTSKTIEFSIFFLLWLIGLVYAWGKYPQYYVAWNMDLGREVMVPLRILSGETPLKDFHLLYPAFSYYLNAWFLSWWGKGLNQLFLLGAIQSAVYLFLGWVFLCRSSLEKWPRRLITLVYITCSLFPGENDGRFLFPYSFSYTYSLIFSLVIVFLVDRYLRKQDRISLFGAGLFTGLIVISKQDFLPCAFLAIILGMLLDFFQRPLNQRSQTIPSVLILLVGIGLPILTFNGFLLHQGVTLIQLKENWFQNEIRFQLFSRFPLWVYFHFPVKRFMIFGLILFLLWGSAFGASRNKLKIWGYLSLGLLAVLCFRQIYHDSLQFDFRSWAALLSLAYGIIKMLHLKESSNRGEYLVPLFAVAAIGVQVRPFMSYGVLAVYWEGTLNCFLLLGSLLCLWDLGSRYSGFNRRVFMIGFSGILLAVTLSASSHLFVYFKPERWAAVPTHLGKVFLPAKPLEEKAFPEALGFVNSLPESQRLFAIDGDLLLASAGRLSTLPASQAANQLTPALERKLIQDLSQDKTDYVFLIQNGNFYPSVLGFLYGLDLYQFLRSNYQTYKMWGGNIPFEQFQAFKNTETMIYILKKKIE